MTRFVVREVEAQPVGPDARTRLLHVRAEHFAQRPVQHVRGGVVAADAVAAHAVDLGLDLVAFGDRADAHPAPVHRDLAGQAVLRVDDVDDRAGRGRDRAGVADLAARLRVERRAVEHDVDLDALVGLRRRARPPTSSASTFAVRRVLLAAGELGRAVRVDELAEHLERRALRRAGFGGVGAGADALFLHALVEAGEVDGAAALPRDLAGEVDREAERVVQEERVLAARRRLARRSPSSMSTPRCNVARNASSSRSTIVAHDVVRRRRSRGTRCPSIATTASTIAGQSRRRARRAGTRAAPRGG